MQKRAAIYLRQSMDNEEGIEGQRTRTRALALARGWEVVAEYTDNNVKASKSRDTAEWAEMIARSQAGDFEVIVATKVDRLARRVRDILDLADSGVGIATVEGELDTTTEMGRFQAVLLTALAELEIGRKGQRHKDAHLDRAAKGIPRTTKRPYGWKKDGMTPEPEEAEHLATALRNILDGKSIRGEVKRMNDAGARTPVYAKSGGLEWTPKALTSVLERPRMAGINTYLGTVTEKSQIQPIVTVEEWEAFNALRKSKDRLSRAQGDTDSKTALRYYLSGVPYCPCGATLRARPVLSRDKKVPYYQCIQSGKGHVGIAVHRLEKVVEMRLYGDMSGGWLKSGGTGEKVRDIRKEIATVEEQRSTATDALLVPGVSKAKVTTQLAALNVEREKLDARLEKAISDDFGAEWLDALMTAGEDSYESADAFKTWFDDLDPEKRRALVRGNYLIEVGPGQGIKRVTINDR